MIKQHCISLFSILMLVACAHTSTVKDTSDLQGHWEFIELMSVNIDSLYRDSMNRPRFAIEEFQFSGFDGCNSFSGTWELRGDKIKFDKGVQTLLVCISAKDDKPIDFLFNAAINRNPVILKNEDGSFSIATDLPAELRNWRIGEDGFLELLKSEKIM